MVIAFYASEGGNIIQRAYLNTTVSRMIERAKNLPMSENEKPTSMVKSCDHHLK